PLSPPPAVSTHFCRRLEVRERAGRRSVHVAGRGGRGSKAVTRVTADAHLVGAGHRSRVGGARLVPTSRRLSRRHRCPSQPLRPTPTCSTGRRPAPPPTPPSTSPRRRPSRRPSTAA